MVKVFKDIDEVSRFAARSFIEFADRSIESRGRFLVALSGGSTPLRLFELLGNEFQDAINWNQVHFFWGDERCVPPNNPGNSYGETKKIWFDKISIPEENIHRVKSELEPEEAALDYAQVLQEFSTPPLAWPRFDLVLLGMGDDGHTASLFPGSPVDPQTPTLAVVANYHDRPANRVTLTPLVINEAREVWFLVAGAGKAVTLFKVLKGERQPLKYPAQRIAAKEGIVKWLVDEDAASQL